MPPKPTQSMEPSAPAGSDVHDAGVLFAEDRRSWWKKPHLLQLNLMVFSCLLFSSANGYDGTLMNGLQALPPWQSFMHHPKGGWLGFINAAQAMGSIIAGYPAAWTGKTFGRKTGIYLAYMFLTIGTTLQTAAPNPGCFITARVFVGFATQFFGNSAPVLVTEIAYPSHRGIVTALYQCGWYVGSLIAAWATFGVRDYTTSWSWRIPSLLQIAIPLLTLPGFLFAPESPRYLIAKDRIDEAKNILVRYHGGGVQDAMISLEIEEIIHTLRAEHEAKKANSWSDMLKTKGNRHRTLISITLGIFAQWNGVGVVSYYLVLVLQAAGVTAVRDQTLLNGCLQIWNLILSVGAAFSVDRFGRRRLFLTSAVGMLISYICITGLSGSFDETGVASVGIAVIPFLFLFYGFYDIAFTPLTISYTAEIWPYGLRIQGMALVQISTQLAVFFNIFVNPIALDAIGWKYYIVFVAILVVIIATIWVFYPETKGHTLEEMATIFDTDDAAGALALSGTKKKGTDVETAHIETAT
ncbi:sugar transporter [Aspergillus pseudoustus]|uniref:Sugar transporter n=1 Tax=Aspergillus pseudoustus TaxID=1810923 RepID=A0ABR4JK65_9EURO